MNKIREIEITKSKPENGFGRKIDIEVDGVLAIAEWNADTMADLKELHKDDTDVADEMVKVVIPELKRRFNLSVDETEEYTKLLTHILTD